MFFLKRYDNAGFLFKNFRILRLSDKKVDSNFFNLNERDKVNTLLYGLKQMILNVFIEKFLNL